MDAKLLEQIKKIGDLYGLLQIGQTDDLKEIRKAYREQAAIYHPDKNQAKEAREIFEKLTITRDILMDATNKEAYDKYLKNQKYHEERVHSLNQDRKKFADDILKREKEEEERVKQETQKKTSKEQRYHEEMEKMKKDWKDEEEKRKEEFEKSIMKSLSIKKLEKQKEMESKEFSMIKVKWSKNMNINYTEDIIKMMFSPYGEIKGVVLVPNKRKAMIEYRHRLSAEKAVEDNKDKDVDDGLKVKLMIKGDKKKDNDKPDKKAKDPTIITSENLDKIANMYNRTSKFIVGSHVNEVRRMEEKQRLMNQILKEEGLDF